MPDGIAGAGRDVRIGSFRLDLESRRLRDPTGRDVALRPKTFDVLQALVERKGGLVGRGELLDRVWGDVNVTDDSITQCIGEIRRALGSGHAKALRTIPRRGYVLDLRTDAPPEEPRPASVAVVPFVGLGSVAAGALGTALAEDLAVELARCARLNIILPPLADVEGGAETTSGAAGAGHQLRGSVRLRAAGQARITAQLVLTAQRSVTWAGSFDGRMADLVFLEEHDEIVRNIARAVCSAIQVATRRV